MWPRAPSRYPAAWDTCQHESTGLNPSRSTVAPAATAVTDRKRIEAMPQGVTIRVAQPSDQDSILTVVREAFARGGRDGQEEVYIVVDTWKLGAAVEGLELVAVDGGSVV